MQILIWNFFIFFLGIFFITAGTLKVNDFRNSHSKKQIDDEGNFNADIIWHFNGPADFSGKYEWANSNTTNVQINVEIPGKQQEISIEHGGDGRVAVFNGQGCLTFSSKSENAILSPFSDFSIYLRVKPLKSGGLLRTDLFSLVIHESGLVIGILGVRDLMGSMYREIPFTKISMNEWHDVIIRFRAGYIDFVLDGNLLNHIRIPQETQVIDPGPILLGGWQIDDPPLSGFPDHVIAFLFQRFFEGSMDHVVIWTRALSDFDIAQLCKVNTIEKSSKISIDESSKCLNDYLKFFDASRNKDVVTCEQLGLSMRTFMAKDPKRPVYHLTAPMDAILDPAGSFYHNGKYHVFSYRNMVSLLALTPLAHFVSDDLIHWKDMPIGVWSDSELDVYGIWLTNLFYDDRGIPSMIYTALGKKGKIGVLAHSYDDLVSFTDKQAVMTNMIHHDGHTWKDGDTWYSLTTKQYWGKRTGDLGDAIILLTSKDLVNWTEKGEIFSVRKHLDPKSDQQCWGFTEYPYLLPFGDKYVLITGTRPAQYWVGQFDMSRPAFIPDDDEGKLLDHLNTFHCFNPSIIDDRGPDGSSRRIIQSMHLYASGEVGSIRWYGVHLLPRVLTFKEDRLIQEPVPEVKTLRSNRRHYESITIQENTAISFHEPGINACEIIAEFDPGTATRFGLKIHTNNDHNSLTEIFYDVSDGQIGVIGNIKIPSPYAELGQASVYIPEDQPVQMHLFLDHSVFELFVNGQTFSGVFDDYHMNKDIELFSIGGETTLNILDAWEMKPAWEFTQ
ncbi:GH32 C-terminal domain-containing protein [Bacteroidota bacterium]